MPSDETRRRTRCRQAQDGTWNRVWRRVCTLDRPCLQHGRSRPSAQDMKNIIIYLLVSQLLCSQPKFEVPVGDIKERRVKVGDWIYRKKNPFDPEEYSVFLIFGGNHRVVIERIDDENYNVNFTFSVCGLDGVDVTTDHDRLQGMGWVQCPGREIWGSTEEIFFRMKSVKPEVSFVKNYGKWEGGWQVVARLEVL